MMTSANVGTHWTVPNSLVSARSRAVSVSAGRARPVARTVAKIPSPVKLNPRGGRIGGGRATSARADPSGARTRPRLGDRPGTIADSYLADNELAVHAPSSAARRGSNRQIGEAYEAAQPPARVGWLRLRVRRRGRQSVRHRVAATGRWGVRPATPAPVANRVSR